MKAIAVLVGEDGVYYPAQARITGSAVYLTCDKVENVKSVRYGFSAMFIVMQDGTEIEYVKTLGHTSDKNSATIVAKDGTVYVIEKDTGVVIETRYGGNVTNGSGHPMPTFELEVGYIKL